MIATQSVQLLPHSDENNEHLLSKSSNLTKSVQLSSTKPLYKYLLQNNVTINNSKQSARSQEEIQVIQELLEKNAFFKDFNVDLNNQSLYKDLCNNILLMYSQNAHIAEIKQNEIYLILEGQGFQYMQNNQSKKQTLKSYLNEQNEYLMIRKIKSNEYFIVHEPNGNMKYNSFPTKKYQLMIDQNTLLGKFSDQVYTKHFLPKIVDRYKSLTAFLKKIAFFDSISARICYQFSRFMQEEHYSQKDIIYERSKFNKDVFFIKSGKIQLKHYVEEQINQKNTPNDNYLVAITKSYPSQILNENEFFGMEKKEQELRQTYAECVSQECTLQKIDKRILAIIITSHEGELQKKYKNWSYINMNNQIKGQSYCSPQKQMLLQNALRIRTTQKKIRDIKLRYLTSNKKKPLADDFEDNQLQQIEKERNDNPKISSTARLQANRRLIKTSQGRFRQTGSFLNIRMIPNKKMSLGSSIRLIDRRSPDPASYQTINIKSMGVASSQIINLVPLSLSESLLQIGSSRREVQIQRPKAEYQGLIKSSRGRIYSTVKMESDMMSNFLSKKIKNQINTKVEKVNSFKKIEKTNESKSLKRLFPRSSTSLNKNVVIDRKKKITDELLEKMMNMSQNPLLFKIQTARKKIQKLEILKKSPKKTISKQSEKKDIVIQDEMN